MFETSELVAAVLVSFFTVYLLIVRCRDSNTAILASVARVLTSNPLSLRGSFHATECQSSNSGLSVLIQTQQLRTFRHKFESSFGMAKLLINTGASMR